MRFIKFVLDKLFPETRRWPSEMPKARHGMRVITDVRLGFVERLRVLVSGHIRVDTTSLWQFTTTKAWSYTTCTVMPPSRKPTDNEANEETKPASAA